MICSFEITNGKIPVTYNFRHLSGKKISEVPKKNANEAISALKLPKDLFLMVNAREFKILVRLELIRKIFKKCSCYHSN
jgi:hypothetical protein